MNFFLGTKLSFSNRGMALRDGEQKNMACVYYKQCISVVLECLYISFVIISRAIIFYTSY